MGFKNKHFRKEAIMRVGITGSREYTDRRKIFDFVGLCKNKFKDEVEIVSGGCPDGADRYAKEAALELGVKYVEFPPYHARWNAYCNEPEYLFGRPYDIKYFHIRNQKIVEYSDKIAAFIPPNHESRGTNSTLRFAKKFDKPYIIIN